MTDPYQRPPQPATTRSANGLATGGFVLGLLGLLFSFIPLIGIIAWPLVILGLIFGSIGLARARKGASGRGLSIAAIILSVLGLIVCIIWVAALGSNSPPTGTISDAPGAPPLNPAQPQPTEGTAENGIATFGQRFTLPSGLAIEVAAPMPFQASSEAAGTDRDREVLVETTIINGTDRPYEFNSFVVGPDATHNGETAPQIFDAGQNIDIAPVTTILPGRSFTYRTAFSIDRDPGELQLEYSADFGGPAAIFVGQA